MIVAPESSKVHPWHVMPLPDSIPWVAIRCQHQCRPRTPIIASRLLCRCRCLGTVFGFKAIQLWFHFFTILSLCHTSIIICCRFPLRWPSSQSTRTVRVLWKRRSAGIRLFSFTDVFGTRIYLARLMLPTMNNTYTETDALPEGQKCRSRDTIVSSFC